VRARIEVVTVPVSDPDVAKEFYVGRLGFTLDHDQTVNEAVRFIQVTPPGSACSISFGRGLSDMEPGSLRAVMLVIDDAEAARAELIAAGVEASDVDPQPWGRFVTFQDPDGNRWTLQELPHRG
jgi:catechol 2,3-dioxygenase-like lactoylglutathione lyase family enzyme